MTTALTAAVQGRARVLLQLTWTTVTSATVSRVHADGTTWPVRNAEPAAVLSTTGVGWTGYDHEAPLDQAVTYRATSTQDATVLTSSAVTVVSGEQAWLTHPGKPSLGGITVIRDDAPRSMPGRLGLHQVIGRAAPVAVWDTRTAESGVITVQTSTAAGLAAMRALVADGAPLLYRTPASWGGDWLYLAVSDAGLTRLDGATAMDKWRHWPLAYQAVDRPAGASQGAVGATYADAAAAYATYALLNAGEASYTALATQPGP